MRMIAEVAYEQSHERAMPGAGAALDGDWTDRVTEWLDPSTWADPDEAVTKANQYPALHLWATAWAADGHPGGQTMLRELTTSPTS
jgi:hypothetical protein